MTRDANTAFARAFVDELRRGGVCDAVISPGSRSAPLALALADEPRIRTHVVLDERSAAFVALGLGRATGRPAMVLTTSGTAAANLHPAVLEAHHAAVPLLAVTADRPPELRGVGAPQTIDQIELFGGAVRWFVDIVPVDEPGAGAPPGVTWRELAARAVRATGGVHPGPVHVNVGFREPLIPTGAPLVDARGRPGDEPFLGGSTVVAGVVDPAASATAALSGRVARQARGVLALGGGAAIPAETIDAFTAATGWIVVADPTAAVGRPAAQVQAIEALLRDEAFASAHEPATWIRVGEPLVSSVVTRWLDQVPGVRLDAAGRWIDPGHTVTEVVAADPAAALAAITAEATGPGDPTRASTGASTGASSWASSWAAADARAHHALTEVLDGWAECAEPRVARDLVAAVPVGTALVVASSMPIRDVAWFATPRADVHVFCNRGVNGIDGFVSTALGVALGHDGPTVAFSGDLSFLHDQGGVLALARLGTPLVIVVVDNDGGGIFSFLPQAELPDHFDTVFATPPGADVAAIASAHGLAVHEVRTPDQFVPALHTAITDARAAIVHVVTDRARNVEHHREAWAAVAAAVHAV